MKHVAAALVFAVVALFPVAGASAKTSVHPTYALGKAKSCRVGYHKQTRRHKVHGRERRYVACVYSPASGAIAGTTTTAPAPSSASFALTPTDRWAGYYEEPGEVTSARATWRVPHLSCSSETSLSSTWVGVGGLDGSVLLQVGMFDNCIDGVAENGAFAEEYPGSTTSFQLLISAGDTVTASVALTAGTWEATLTDDTTGQQEKAAASGYAGGGSAEWFVEAYGQPSYPLTNFGAETFSDLMVNGSAAVPDEGWEMEDSSGSLVAVPSNPSSGSHTISYR